MRLTLRLRTLKTGDRNVAEVFNGIPVKCPPRESRAGEVSGEGKQGRVAENWRTHGGRGRMTPTCCSCRESLSPSLGRLLIRSRSKQDELSLLEDKSLLILFSGGESGGGSASEKEIGSVSNGPAGSTNTPAEGGPRSGSTPS